MKKTAFILTALFISVSVSACKEQPASSETPVSVSESSILASVEESSEINSSDITVEESSNKPSIIEEVSLFEGNNLENYNHLVVNNKCRLLSYNGTEKKIVVPERVTVDGKEYETEIGAGCFKEKDIISLILPDNITEIPDSMCESCKQLSEVKFSNVSSIGKKAFWKCENFKFQLSELNNGNEAVLKKIGETAFGFSGIYGKVAVKSDMELEAGSFQVCMKVNEVEICSGVTELPDRLFSECDDIEKVTLPDTLIKIGDYAFYQSKVPNIVIPQSVKEMGWLWITTNSVLGGKYTGVILGYKGSAAETYAKDNDITFSALD